MAKQLLIIDNDDQSDAIDKINKIAKEKGIDINCLQFNVGLPDGNDVIDQSGRIDMALVREKFENLYGSRRFHAIAFDFRLNEPVGGIDGIELLKYFNLLEKTRKAKKILYSSELTEIVEEYLNNYRTTSNYEEAWSNFKTLINLEILGFHKKEEYEEKVIQYMGKINDSEEDFIVEELRSNKGLSFNPSIEIYEGLTFDEIADRIESGDSQSMKFKRKLLELAIANLAYLKNEL
jgi:hypothetical protein